MFIHNINPTLFKIGTLEIRYYGIIYALGFIIAYFMLIHISKIKNIKLTKDDIADYIFYLILGTIIGARLSFILYNIPYFLNNPLEIIAIWKGGLIFLGGFVGAILAGTLFLKKKKIPFYQLADITVIPLALALALGRIANFINGELVGTVTKVPWAVKFPLYEGFRHPVQLYNSLALLMIFGILWYLKDKNIKKGTLFWLFLSLYSLERFILGFFKAADEKGLILALTIEQLTYIVTFIIGSLFLYKINKK